MKREGVTNLPKGFLTTLASRVAWENTLGFGEELWSGRTGSSLQMNRLSLRNNRLKFKAAGKLPIILEEFIEYTPI